ncbi:hypothetical protein OHB11_10400 [Streptomyces zaomyceticus]|uniref:FXSXX-COOH protein n=1 Tax=Streptomyces zaomyceticus TaxID=68286 RepID=A0ABZ1LA14_9ACTN|nr:hypothetical protein OG237_31325 [Streptomyces zaomyceticus]
MSDILTNRPLAGDSSFGPVSGAGVAGLVIEDIDNLAPQSVALFTICVMAAQSAPAQTSGARLSA